MAFRITQVKTESFPSEQILSEALRSLNISKERIVGALEGFVCKAPLDPGRGYQQDLASELERHLESALANAGVSASYNRAYSFSLNERADIVFNSNGSDRCLFVEIEFRPNVEKDLVKFQIGHNTGRLGAAVLILATNRDSINKAYTTMPEFGKFLEVIRELQPPYPLLLCGIDGESADNATPG